MLELTILKTKNAGMFVAANTTSYSSPIPNYFFDGEKLVTSNMSGWYKLSKIPKEITKQGQSSYKNVRYELKAGYPVSDLTPATLKAYDFEENGYEDVKGLYDYKYEIDNGELEQVEFTYEILDEEIDYFIENPKFSYTISLLDQITSHPVLKQNKPCKIGSEALYVVVREYIRKNIDSKIAYISSDYNFCLTVKKYIDLYEPVKYKVDEGTKRRPNLVTKQRFRESITVFQSAPKAYQDYIVQEPISAANYAELEQKVNDYLEHVIKAINEPLVECSCCKGRGVITKEV